MRQGMFIAGLWSLMVIGLGFEVLRQKVHVWKIRGPFQKWSELWQTFQGS